MSLNTNIYISLEVFKMDESLSPPFVCITPRLIFQNI